MTAGLEVGGSDAVSTASSFQPVVIADVLQIATLDSLREWIEVWRHSITEWDSTFARWSAHLTHLGERAAIELHWQLTSVATEIFGEAVKPSYSFLSLYGPGGVCPPHTDRSPCRWTIDLCVNDSLAATWPLYVDGVPHVFGENSALCYSGTTQCHYREPLTSEPAQVDLLFFHFVPDAFIGSMM